MQQGSAQRHRDKHSQDDSDSDYEDHTGEGTSAAYNLNDNNNDMEAEAPVSSHTATTARYVNVASFTPFRTKSNQQTCDQRDCTFSRINGS